MIDLDRVFDAGARGGSDCREDLGRVFGGIMSVAGIVPVFLWGFFVGLIADGPGHIQDTSESDEAGREGATRD